MEYQEARYPFPICQKRYDRPIVGYISPSLKSPVNERPRAYLAERARRQRGPVALFNSEYIEVRPHWAQISLSV